MFSDFAKNYLDWIYRNPFMLASMGTGVAAAAIFLSVIFPALNRPPDPTVGAAFLALLSIVFGVASYLKIFARDETVRSESYTLRDSRLLLKELRAQTSQKPTQVNFDDGFKEEVLNRISKESQAALEAFIEKAAFKKAADANHKETKFEALSSEAAQIIDFYKVELVLWRRNANINLVLGLACALGGIWVMWQTLVTLPFEPTAAATWSIGDLYKFLARLGLVLIIESVAFFFLKLYREDRSMIRYFRNEITNLELKTLALKSSITFAKPETLAKVLQMLAATERNFLLKKGERAMADLPYENSEILLEKLLDKNPGLLARAAAKVRKTDPQE
jgi:hypothetical protein